MTTPREQYAAREKRIQDAIALRRPDRVPVAFSHTLFYMTKRAGITNKDAMIDHKKRLDAWKEQTVKIGPDLAIHPITLPPAQPFEILKVGQFKWPGGGLPDDASFQYVEKEYMKADEYDAFLADPGDFTVRVIWPRIANALAPLAALPPLHWASNSRNLAYMFGPMFGMAPIAKVLRDLLKLGEAAFDFTLKMYQYTAEMKMLGFPVGFASAADSPFDYLSEQFRGMRGIMLDMFRQPDKVLAAVDRLTPMQIDAARMLAMQADNNRVYMPLHRGSAEFMSDAQFAKFYWPGVKKVLLALIDANLVPVPYFEGEYTPRLKYLAELPKGKIMAHFDRVDRKKARDIIGDTMCFWGNIPSSLMITGTVDQVRDDVKDLIDTFGDTGGLIVDGAMGLPDEAKPENVEAVVETVMTYGRG